MEKLKWIEGDPEQSGIADRHIWIVNEDGDTEIVRLSSEGFMIRRPKGFRLVAWAGPIEEPDESTLP